MDGLNHTLSHSRQEIMEVTVYEQNLGTRET